MALDLIKEYLVGIGFSVDSNSLKNAQQSINNADQTIKKFNNESNKGFSDTSESLNDLFSLFTSTGAIIGKLFPELQHPFKGLIRDINTIKNLYSELSKIKFKENLEDVKVRNEKDKFEQSTDYKNKPQKNKQKPQRDVKVDFKPNVYNNSKNSKELSVIPQNKDLINTSENLVESVLNAKDATNLLKTEGGSSIKAFASTSIGSFAIVATGIVALIAITKKFIDYLGNLAEQDIQYEKLSRQLWTTKENAKEIDSALKTLGITMNDLWLSPTLLKQFNQLRKDSAALKLPKEYTDNLKVIQGISLEFKRLKQLGTLAFQWIGNYILKYAAGPLLDLKQAVHSFNDWLVKSIPNIAKVIGSAIGIIVRILLRVAEIFIFINAIQTKISIAIWSLLNKIPEPLKKILKIIAILGIAILAGPIGAIILVIALIDDLITAIKGGKSIIGNSFETIKEKGKNAIKSIKEKYKELKENFNNGMKSMGDDWDYYWNKGKRALEKLEDKAKKVWANIKEWSKGMWEKAKEKIPGLKATIETFSGNKNNANSTMASYTSSHNTTASNTTTSNSNNTVTNANTFNVYAGNDANSTANSISNKVIGITTRNLQGVY